MNWSDPTVVAGIFGAGGVVLATAANLITEARRESREVARDEANAKQAQRALTFEHKRAAYDGFASEVHSLRNAIWNADLLKQWGGGDFDTYDDVSAKQASVDLYGSDGVRDAAKATFKALVDFGGTVKTAEADVLEQAMDRFRDAARRDLGLPIGED